MFNKILDTAHQSGAEVLVHLKDFCCEPFKGRVLEMDQEYFSLFHSGPGGGVHWAFKLEDVAFCGLVLELPDPIPLQAPLPSQESDPFNPSTKKKDSL